MAGTRGTYLFCRFTHIIQHKRGSWFTKGGWWQHEGVMRVLVATRRRVARTYVIEDWEVRAYWGGVISPIAQAEHDPGTGNPPPRPRGQGSPNRNVPGSEGGDGRGGEGLLWRTPPQMSQS